MADFADTVRVAASDRYFASLYAPAERRADLHVLYAFDAEIAAIRDKVSTPMLGEFRLQWWRDALENGEGGGNPLAESLIDVMRRHDLPVRALLDLLEARVFDLYDDPFPTWNDLEGYAGETRGRISMLASAILAPQAPRTGPIADAAGHGAIASLLRDVLLHLPTNAARGQLYLPADTIAAYDANASELASQPISSALQEELRDRTAAHLSASFAALRDLPAAARPAFLPLTTIATDLAKARPAATWRRLWVMRAAARKGF